MKWWQVTVLVIGPVFVLPGIVLTIIGIVVYYYKKSELHALLSVSMQHMKVSLHALFQKEVITHLCSDSLSCEGWKGLLLVVYCKAGCACRF